MRPRSLAISRYFTPEMREWKCLLHGERCRQAGGTLCDHLLTVPFLSFRLSRLTLSQPLPELPLTFVTLVVGEDVRQDAPGDVLDYVLRNTGIVDELLLAAQVGCSLRFDMKFFKVQLWTGGQSVADGMAPFLRNGKCRRLSSHWLDGRLHFAFLYYITLRVGVNSFTVEKLLLIAESVQIQSHSDNS